MIFKKNSCVIHDTRREEGGKSTEVKIFANISYRFWQNKLRKVSNWRAFYAACIFVWNYNYSNCYRSFNCDFSKACQFSHLGHKYIAHGAKVHNEERIQTRMPMLQPGRLLQKHWWWSSFFNAVLFYQLIFKKASTHNSHLNFCAHYNKHVHVTLYIRIICSFGV
jgi:hypothetical protein